MEIHWAADDNRVFLPDMFVSMLDNGKKAAACELINLYGRRLLCDGEAQTQGSKYLKLAMEADAPEVIKLLIAGGVGGEYNGAYHRVVNSTAEQFSTPVIVPSSDNYVNVIALAIMDGNREVAIKMIKETVNINAWEDKDRTLLMWAALKDDIGIVQVLLEEGADITRTNRSSHTALDAAIWRLQRIAAAALTSGQGLKFIKKELIEAQKDKDKVLLIKLLRTLTGCKSEESEIIRFLMEKGCQSHQLNLYEKRHGERRKHMNLFEKIDEVILSGQKIKDAVEVLSASL